MATIGDRLAEVLKEQNLTANAIAVRCGVSPQTVRNIISGNSPRADIIAKILGELPGYNAHWLITGDGEKRLFDHLSVNEPSQASYSTGDSTRDIMRMVDELRYRINDLEAQVRNKSAEIDELRTRGTAPADQSEVMQSLRAIQEQQQQDRQYWASVLETIVKERTE